MEAQGIKRETRQIRHQGAGARGRSVVPVVMRETTAGCRRPSWWRRTEQLVGVSTSVPSRTPALILPTLTARQEASEPSTWFVGSVPLGKRILDLSLIALSLPILVPLFLAIGAFIKIVSPGPVFFTQERVGYRERRFRIWKFRSMRVNAETTTHAQHTTFLFKSDRPMEKMDHVDPRLIPFAWVLRSTGIDELPQLINVVLGQMSLVGPRPCTAYEHEVMLPWHKRRFGVLPGLTGLWQVNGKNKTTFQQMINFDLAYARQWSLGLDLRIMFSTFPVLYRQLRDMVGKRRAVKAPAGPTEPAAA